MVSFENLSRKLQLNCICNHNAKKRIAADGMDGAVSGRMFPLEPTGLFIHRQKMTSETGGQIQYWAHHQLAQLFHCKQKILSLDQYDSMDWKLVCSTLHDLPWLFQVWAFKHVLGITGMIKFLAHQNDRSPLCSSCNKCKGTCKRITQCPDAGCALAFEQCAQGIEQSLEKNNTHPNLWTLLLQYLAEKVQSCAPSA
jgi:hypothetical protein